MPLTEETKKRIAKIFIVAILICGALFMLFAFFLNKGTLAISGKAPYMVSVEGVKTVTCGQDDCKIEIAPGEYQVAITKGGYKQVNLTVNVPIASETKHEIKFQIMPALILLGEEKTLNLFLLPSVKADDLPAGPLFYDENYVVYIERDPQTHRQTVYTRSIKEEKAGEKTVVTSFIRDLKNYLIFPSIEKNGKIALIDVTENGSTLYILDLKNKTRNSILTYPEIKNVKWLPGTDDIIFEGRGEGEIASSVYFYSAETHQAKKLELQTPLTDVVAATGDRLIAATMQGIGDNNNLSGLEGSLVTLTENEATPEALTPFTITSAPVLKFIEYSITADQTRLLKAAPDLSLPQNAKLSETAKSAYFLIDGKDYELVFSD
jgi:hypothetical protein